MKKRIATAVVMVPLLILLLLVAPQWLAAVLFGVMMAIAAYELLYRTRLVRQGRLVIYSAVMAFAVVLWSYFGALQAYLLLGLLVFVMLLFMEMMMDHVKVHLETLGLCMVGGFLVPYLLSALIRILTMRYGRYVILIPFVVAFLSDSGAYFVGLKFGKHKLSPVVSPNKTIEGALGGIVGFILSYGIFLINHLLDNTVKDEKDLKSRFNVNVLGVVPSFYSEADLKKKTSSKSKKEVKGNG